MKKLILALLLALPSPALAAQAAQPSGYPPQLDYGSGGTASAKPLPDYLGLDTVPLTRGEQRALRRCSLFPAS